MRRDELKRWAREVRPDLPTGDVIDALAAEYHGPGTVYSPAEIVERVGANPDAVLAALLLLAGEPMHVLKGQWFLFDQNGDELPLPAEEVVEALRSNEFYHPLSGAQIFDFKKAIGLVYEADRFGPGFPEAVDRDG